MSLVRRLGLVMRAVNGVDRHLGHVALDDHERLDAGQKDFDIRSAAYDPTPLGLVVGRRGWGCFLANAPAYIPKPFNERPRCIPNRYENRSVAGGPECNAPFAVDNAGEVRRLYVSQIANRRNFNSLSDAGVMPRVERFGVSVEPSVLLDSGCGKGGRFSAPTLAYARRNQRRIGRRLATVGPGARRSLVSWNVAESPNRNRGVGGQRIAATALANVNHASPLSVCTLIIAQRPERINVKGVIH